MAFRARKVFGSFEKQPQAQREDVRDNRVPRPERKGMLPRQEKTVTVHILILFQTSIMYNCSLQNERKFMNDVQNSFFREKTSPHALILVHHFFTDMHPVILEKTLNPFT